MNVMTLIIKLILILFIPITFAQASFPVGNNEATKNWEVRGFVFNTALQFWAKTSCRLALSVPGSVAYIPSDCNQNAGPDEEDSLLYYHGDNYPGDNTNGGKISGVVRSKVFGDILFGDKIPNGKNCNLLRGNNRNTKIVKFQDGVVRVTGCAYIKKLDEYIYLSPFTPSSNSKKTLTGADSAWLGLTAEIKIDRGLNENLQDDIDGTDGITGGNFLAILGCGWSPNFGYWNFGLKDLSGANNNSGVTDCEFEPPSPRSVDQRIFDTRVGFEEPVRTGLTVPHDVVFGALGEISGACATGFGGANIEIGEKPPTTYNPNNEKQISFSFKLLFIIPVTITLSCKNDPEEIFIFSGALSSDVDVETTSNELIVAPQAVQGFGKVEVVSKISNTSPNDTKIECSVNRGGVDNINTEIINFQHCGLLTIESSSQQLVLSDTTFVQECIKTELNSGSFDENCVYSPDTDTEAEPTNVRVITELPPKTITIKALPTVIVDRNKKSLPRGATATCRNGRIDKINIPANTNTLNIYYIQEDSLSLYEEKDTFNNPYNRPNVLNNISEFIVEVSNSKSAPFPVRTLLRDSDCGA